MLIPFIRFNVVHWLLSELFSYLPLPFIARVPGLENVIFADGICSCSPDPFLLLCSDRQCHGACVASRFSVGGEL